MLRPRFKTTTRLPGPADLDEALDAIPSGEFLGLCAVFAEMAENGPEASARFLKVLGRMFGSSIESRNADLDPETRAFAEGNRRILHR